MSQTHGEQIEYNIDIKHSKMMGISTTTTTATTTITTISNNVKHFQIKLTLFIATLIF